MVRVLKFDDYERGKRRFALMQQAVLLAMPTQTAERGFRSVDVIRREAGLLNALDRISVPDESIKDNPAGVPARVLRKDVKELELSQPEYDLLRERVDPMRMPWSTSSARDVVSMIDWIDGAERVDALP